MDLNDDMWVMCIDGRCSPIDFRFAPTAGRKPEAYAGAKFRELLLAHDMAPLLSHRFEPTFFPGARGQPKRIDFLCGPRNLECITKKAHTLSIIGKRLQLIPDREPRDHVPVAAFLDYVLEFPQRQRPTISLAATAEAWRTGRGWTEFVALVEHKCQETTARLGYQPDGTHLAKERALLIADIRDAAETVFPPEGAEEVKVMKALHAR